MKISKKRNKWTIEKVKDVFKKNGYILLSNEYINSAANLDYVCICGNKSKTNLNRALKGVRCFQCSTEKQRFDFKEVKNIFEYNGCILLSTEYKNNKSDLEYICECGNTCLITFTNFKRGGRCRCSSVDRQRLDVNFVKGFFEKNNCKLISDYKQCQQKLEFVCFCGKIGIKDFGSFKEAPYCRDRGIETRSGENHPCWKEDKDKQKLRKYISRYSNLKLRSYWNKQYKNTTKQSVDKIGYGAKEFQEHIKSHPNFKNLKNKKISFDHVFPMSCFIDHSILDLKIINHLSNIQPLTRSENSSKGFKYNKNEFYLWLNTLGYNYNTETRLLEKLGESNE